MRAHTHAMPMPTPPRAHAHATSMTTPIPRSPHAGLLPVRGLLVVCVHSLGHDSDKLGSKMASQDHGLFHEQHSTRGGVKRPRAIVLDTVGASNHES